jgi:hypothetical protein
MKTDREFEDLLRKLACPAGEDFKNATRAKMLAALPEAPAAARRGFARAFPGGRLARVAAAAALLAAVAFVVFRPDGAHVVLADVVKKIAATSTLIHRETREGRALGSGATVIDAEAVKYLSDEFGLVEKQYDRAGALTHVAYVLKKEARCVILLPPLKKYLDLPLTDALAATTDDVSPRGIVELLTRFGSVPLGRATFDGHEVEGFEASRESATALLSAYRLVAFLCPIKPETLSARLWVDVHTSLPVGAEADCQTGPGLLTGFRAMAGHFRAYDFQWNAPIDPAIFSPEIPPDYERIAPASFGQ